MSSNDLAHVCGVGKLVSYGLGHQLALTFALLLLCQGKGWLEYREVYTAGESGVSWVIE